MSDGTTKTPLLTNDANNTDGTGDYELSADLSPTALKAFFTNICHLPQYYDVFVENNYNSLKILKHLTNNDLVDMEIDNAEHRRLILSKIASFDTENPAQVLELSKEPSGFVDVQKSLTNSPKRGKNGSRRGSKEMWSNKNEFESFVNEKRRSSIIDIQAIAVANAAGAQKGLTKDMSDEERSQYIQELRSEGMTKWWILLCFVFVKSAAILNVLAVSSLESTMLTRLNLSNSEFALLTSLVFVTAAPFSMVVPYIIDKIKVYSTSVIAQTLITIGQIVFVIGCQCGDSVSWGSGIALMYTSRVIFGCGFAMVQICTYTVVSLWFGASKWNSFALVIIGQTVEIGILMARYTVLPLYNINESFWFAYGIGIIWAAISIGTTWISGMLERNFSKELTKRLNLDTSDGDEDAAEAARKLTEVALTRDFRQVKEFPLKIWLIMLLIVLGWANIETFASQMTVPLIEKYGISEWYADVILSASTFVAFTVGPLTGWIAGKWGRKVLDIYVFATQGFFILGVIIYLMPGWNDVGFAWLCVCVFNVGLQTFYGGIFPLLFIECPAYLMAIANSVNAFAYLVGGFAETWIFGVLGDASGDWDASMWMVAGVSLVSVAIGVWYIRLP